MSGEKYILVDFENVQPANLDRLRDRGFTLRIFLGSVQERLPLKIVNSLQVFGTSLEYVQTCGIGPNALDFYIAYFLGRKSLESPDAQFFIISRDTGFDPLLRQLRSQGTYCRRVVSADEICNEHALTEAVHALSACELMHKVMLSLAKHPNTRPRTLKRLRSSMNALFGKKLLAKQLDDLVEELKKRGVLHEDADRLHYQMPGPVPEHTPEHTRGYTPIPAPAQPPVSRSALDPTPTPLTTAAIATRSEASAA